MKKVAICSPRFADGATVGGAETLLRRFAARLLMQGVEVDYLTTCASNHFTWANDLPAGESNHDGIKVWRFPVDKQKNRSDFEALQQAILCGQELSDQEEREWALGSVNSTALLQHLDKHAEEYDRILAGPYLFGLVWQIGCRFSSRMALVPCLHDESFAYLGIMKKMFQKVDQILFNSEPEAQLARRLYNLPADCGRVVGMGLDDFEVSPTAFAKKHNITEPYILYCGRRETAKGTPLLCDYVSAFRERTGRDIKLVFTGSGTIEAPVDLWPHIIDAGFVSEKEKHEAMAGALAFVHPSILESFGIVLLEAMLAQTPGLVHGAGEVLSWQCRQSNGGLWFRCYPEFETALLHLLDNPELCKKLGAAGRDYVLNTYSWAEVDRRLLEALEPS